MKDNIEIERVWQETDFFMVKITCSSEVIKAITQTYITDEGIDELANLIGRFIYDYVEDNNESPENYLWETGEKGDQSTAYVSMRFVRKDSLGHIQIEVYLELDDGGSFSKHNCCFYVETELGLLESFGKRLGRLKEQQIGTRVALSFSPDETE